LLSKQFEAQSSAPSRAKKSWRSAAKNIQHRLVYLFVRFGVAFGHQQNHRSKVCRMSKFLTINCTGPRKAGGYQAVEFQSSRRICGAAEFGCSAKNP
jgi:hypothetical protein